MELAPRVLVVSQPTWGLDVAAAAFIRQSLIDLSREGAAVLVVSEELDELLEMCDRIAVIYRGRLSECRERGEVSVEDLGLLMAGGGGGGAVADAANAADAASAADAAHAANPAHAANAAGTRAEP